MTADESALALLCDLRAHVADRAWFELAERRATAGLREGPEGHLALAMMVQPVGWDTAKRFGHFISKAEKLLNVWCHGLFLEHTEDALNESDMIVLDLAIECATTNAPGAPSRLTRYACCWCSRAVTLSPPCGCASPHDPVADMLWIRNGERQPLDLHTVIDRFNPDEMGNYPNELIAQLAQLKVHGAHSFASGETIVSLSRVR